MQPNDSSTPGEPHLTAVDIQLWDKVYEHHRQLNLTPTVEVPILELLTLLELVPEQSTVLPHTVGAMLLETARSNLLETVQRRIFDLGVALSAAMKIYLIVRKHGQKPSD